MYFATYDFDGDPDVLVPAYDRMMSQFPAELLGLHVCVVHDGGIRIFDGCPTRQDFEAFSDSAEFAAALTAAGLPSPKVTAVGEVHHAIGVAVAA